MKYFSMENWETTSGETRWIKFFLHLIIGFAILGIVIFQFPLGTVGAGERGVQLQFSAVTGKIFGEGLYFRIPFVQKVKVIDVKIQKEQVDADAASKDLQIVKSTVALNFHLNPEQVSNIYKEVGILYKERLIDPAIQESVKASTSKFTAEELITKREFVREEVKTLLKSKMLPLGIVVDEFNIVNFDFSRVFNEAIEAKVTAEQNAFAARNKLEQIKYEAQQKIEEAKGKAEAITIESKALMNNPQVLELRALEKWNGVLPQVVGGSIPFVNIK